MSRTDARYIFKLISPPPPDLLHELITATAPKGHLSSYKTCQDLTFCRPVEQEALSILNFEYHWSAVHCTALQCSALHYTLLHCTALHYTAWHCAIFTTLHFTTLCSTALNYTALHCTELYCTALYCTALHCTALHYSLHHSSEPYTGLHCSTPH